MNTDGFKVHSPINQGLRRLAQDLATRGSRGALCFLLVVCSTSAYALQSALRAEATLPVDASGQMRFAAVHGRRSLVMGYAANGLELWAYPFQILSQYQVGFRQSGSSAEIDGRTLLRRIDYQRESVVRTYIGPDYLVRETLFVPLDQPAVAILYEVEGRRPVDIEIHFEPVLNLMWPGAVGGQYTRWLDDAQGFQIAEPEHHISAMIASPETIAHDDTLNGTFSASMKSFTIRPRAGAGGALRAKVCVVLNPANANDPAAAVHSLAIQLDQEQQHAAAHYTELDNTALRLQTPDRAVNDAVAWAEAALDQAWVCNPMIGCGVVAGYGPSRDARRPQYAWYFAGDGLIATNALVSAGEYARAREELEFIEKYQQPSTGMIWHELSQSAGYIDWSKYPYMYVHVDITFDYLATIARYVAVSGDVNYASTHWVSIARAYTYCHSIVRDADHLPHIPPDKEGGDEQARPGDDLSLSAGWLAASAGFAELARVTGHSREAEEAVAQSRLIRSAIAEHYWNAASNFWIDGHTQSGTVIPGRRRGPSQLLEQQVFSDSQSGAVLDQISSADFLADWGVREVSASAPDYNPYSYGRGSITAPGTAYTAITFWKEHRPLTAEAIWDGLLQWNALDSPGHIHEVLAGNFFQEQAESVPEQTWSSAGLLDAAVRGLLGLEMDGAARRVHFAPHLPADWDQIRLENVHLPGTTLGLTLKQGMGAIDLEIQNSGGPATLDFDPQIPLGAHIGGATCQGRATPANLDSYPEDAQAHLSCEIPSGISHFQVQFDGGISIMLAKTTLHPGDPSTALKLIHASLHDHTLDIEADVNSAGTASLVVRTPWKPSAKQGATVEALTGSEYRITLILAPAAPAGYVRAHASITFEQ